MPFGEGGRAKDRMAEMLADLQRPRSALQASALQCQWLFWQSQRAACAVPQA